MIKTFILALLAAVFAWVSWGKADEYATPAASDLYPVSGTISFLKVETARRSDKPHSMTIYLDEGAQRTAAVSFDISLIDKLQIGQGVRGQAALQNDRNVLWELETSSGLKRSFQDTVRLTQSTNDRNFLFTRAFAVLAVCLFGWCFIRGKSGAA